ncbi:UbiD family decarboxylase [Bradyrhizobium sp. dw_78]|uniref:UbiD family decarboxylase n=1 Tax=Bradyrhizobium sp. dw_78 TaxID=2719793 RepID=UPI001BD61FA4|nr:UbiD family decarboxylase [Bradyrhizobium sp. dw_78]
MIKPPNLDLQAHLAELEAQGLLVRIDHPINKDTELHPLVRCQFLGGIPEDERRAFLFTNVVDSKGHHYDIPVVVGAYAASPRIYAIGMGRPVAEIGKDWLNAISNPITPLTVGSPSCQQVIVKGNDLLSTGAGLESLPVPISTPGFDAAPYLTATLCITADPDSGIRNIGTYRAALKSNNRLGVRMSSRIGGAGGYLHWCKYRDRGQRMPCAIVIGAAPVIAYTGAEKLAIDQDEMSVAGALAGVPIKTAKAITVDLEVPADAEIVIEGLIDTDQLEPEGPFGESNGYVALEEFNMSMEVTAITRKRSPVFISILSQVTPSESSVIKKLALEPLFLNHLRDHLSLKNVLRVVMHEPLTNLRPVIFVQFANGTPRTEVWRGLRGTATRQADCGKIVIAVSEDIDPDNTDAIMWSLAYRSNPIEDIHIEPYRSTGHVPNSAPGQLESTVLIDATLKHSMPPLALPGRIFMERAQALWQELDLPPLSVKSPWHGYSLGDWSDAWEEFARNAVDGAWAKNGESSWARRRSGLKPETPVRGVRAG